MATTPLTFFVSPWNETNSFQERTTPTSVGNRGMAASSLVPSWKMQDIIRLVILPILFAVGAPLNLAALSHLMSEKKTVSSLAGRMHLLKLHLNISDLMILFVYTASQICWLITYEWRGGEFLCRFVKFSHTLSFGISSNVVVCIAFDRLASIFESKRRRSDERRKPGLRRVKISLLLAWTAAVACALPQFLVWTTYRPFASNTWTQCVSIFYIQERNIQERMRHFNQTNNSQQYQQLLMTKTSYAAFHVLAIFWIPAFIIAVCYLNVMAWLVCHGRNSRSSNSNSNENGDGNCCRRYLLCCFQSIRNRLDRSINRSHMAQNIGNGNCRYASIGKPRTAQVGVMIDEGTICEASQASTRNATVSYGALEPPEPGVNLANPTSPKGSGCSSTPLLATAVGDHLPGSRNPSANIVVSAAVLDLQRVKRRAIRSSVLLVIAYIATWLPYNVIALWGFIDEAHFKLHGLNLSFLQYFIVFNSVINPFLYGTVGRLRKYVTNS